MNDVVKRIVSRESFDPEHPPERVWVYTDEYSVLRVAINGPHRNRKRTSVEYVRLDAVETLLAEALLKSP